MTKTRKVLLIVAAQAEVQGIRTPSDGYTCLIQESTNVIRRLNSTPATGGILSATDDSPFDDDSVSIVAK